MFPQTPGQCQYLLALQSNKSVVVATGPAGTGKTLFACRQSMKSIGGFQRKKVIITRPIVAADEDLGYLPGDVDSKMEPWARPMLDIFERELSMSQIERYVEIVPLGYMRGRTFKDCYVIADEMQNSTPNQMLCLLSRLGENSKLVCLGDLAQSDLGPMNGLADFVSRVDHLDLEHVEVVHMEEEDIIRHPAVSEIIKVYNI